jgi:hypothetical protein
MKNQHGRFAFQTGRWRVQHRKLRERLAGCTDWAEFGGTCEAREIMDGAGNIEDNFLNDPDGPYRAAALRRLDPATGEWTIIWLDQRRANVDPPMRGQFEGATGTFFCDDNFGGVPIRVRFIWSHTDTATPRWEQAFSADAGATWETNWIMDFGRIGSTGTTHEPHK